MYNPSISKEQERKSHSFRQQQTAYRSSTEVGVDIHVTEDCHDTQLMSFQT